MADEVIVKTEEKQETPPVVVTPAPVVDNTLVQMATEQGKTSAKVEELAEEHEEIEDKVQSLENQKNWQADDINRLFERVNVLENKTAEVAQEEEQAENIEAMSEVEGAEEKEEESEEKTEAVIEQEKKTGLSLLLALAAAIAIVFGIKYFEKKDQDGDYNG